MKAADVDYKYPIAEIFESIQGEGMYTGVQMLFIRFAGCTVGKPYTKAAREELGLHVYQERCVDWSGAGFACDTNYKVDRRLSIDELVSIIDEYARRREDDVYILFTGGEPLMHPLLPLLHRIANLYTFDNGLSVHIETSGTIDFRGILEDDDLADMPLHIAVSPKIGYIEDALEAASEVKVLVGVDFNEEKFAALYPLVAYTYIYFQPINNCDTLDMDNVNRCLALLKKYPRARISIQLHKILGLR